jgi:hypothetical protein
MNNDAVSNVKIRDRRGYATLYKFRIHHCVDGTVSLAVCRVIELSDMMQFLPLNSIGLWPP